MDAFFLKNYMYSLIISFTTAILCKAPQCPITDRDRPKSNHIYAVAGLIVTLLTLFLWETEWADAATGRRGVHSEKKGGNKKNVMSFLLLLDDYIPLGVTGRVLEDIPALYGRMPVHP